MTDQRLPHSTPEAQGVSSAAILKFVEEAEKTLHELHGFVLVRHGAVIAEGWWQPYAPDVQHMLFSLSKSFTSSAIGLAVAEKRLSVNDSVLSFFPEYAPETVSENLAAMQVRHLLSMGTGHLQDTTISLRQEGPQGSWVRAFLALPVEHAPGGPFVYNSGATYMLSAIVQKVSGMTLLEYLQPRLLAPLGIEHATWETSPEGINMGGWGLNITTHDIACFGQMLLQKGVWKGERILSEDWVAQATSKHISNGDDPESDWAQGYGYQFWRCRHNAYRGDGAFGQYCLVMPDQDAVLAINSGLGDMQEPLSLVWKYLLPEMKEHALPENLAGQAALTDRLASLALVPPAGMSATATAERVNGRTYHFEPNSAEIRTMTFAFEPQGSYWKVLDAKGEHTIALGMAAWQFSESTFANPDYTRLAASGMWTADDTFQITLRSYETPFYSTFTCVFAGDDLKVQSKMNISFGPTEAPEMVGHAG